MAIHFIGGKVPPKTTLEFTLLGKATLRKLTQDEIQMYELLEDISRLKMNGEWWFWKRIGGEDGLDKLPSKLKRKEVKSYLESFREVFDNRWWISVCRKEKLSVAPDPLSAFGGQSPIIRILRLGECIQNVKGEEDLPEKLVKRLRNRRSFWSAATELEIASCFIEAGLDLILYPDIPSGSEPDGNVSFKRRIIYYEVTEQHWSGDQTESAQLERKIVEWLSRCCGPVNGLISFKSAQEGPAIKATELLELLQKSYDRQSRSLKPLPYVLKSGDFEVHLAKADANGGWVGIEGLEPSFEGVLSNWIDRLFEKYKQLPSGQSGVIIGSPLFLWGPQDVTQGHTKINERFRSGLYTRVSGIILCAKHVENSGFMKHVPSVLINENAEIGNREGILKMAQAMFEFPDWL
ncbi:MAG: hypothetical protein ACE5KV_03135 [Thermoplasmata archaeon]